MTEIYTDTAGFMYKDSPYSALRKSGNERGWIYSLPPMTSYGPLPAPHEVSRATCPLKPISGARRD
jgi:hypothetical protein